MIRGIGLPERVSDRSGFRWHSTEETLANFSFPLCKGFTPLLPQEIQRRKIVLQEIAGHLGAFECVADPDGLDILKQSRLVK